MKSFGYYADQLVQLMKLAPIITNLLMQDLYKFSMGQCIFHQFIKYWTKWKFKCRNTDVKFTSEMVKEIVLQIRFMCEMHFNYDDLMWLTTNYPWIHKDYVDCFLRFFHPVPSEIKVNGVSLDHWEQVPATDFGNGLTIEAEGPWLTTSMYEVPILAIVNEVYFAFTGGGAGKLDFEFQDRTEKHVRDLIDHKYTIGNFAEFGMRRRYSSAMQDWLVGYLADKKKKGLLPGFVGTSNVYLAKKYNLTAVGTMAHEFIMCVGQGDKSQNEAYSNKFMMDAWTKEYGTWNGIALTDTIGTNVFLLDFQKTYCRLFDGVRHDSGDPVVWGRKMIAHYQKHGVKDLHTKTLLFSDGLNFEKASELYKEFAPVIGVSFGIGTFLSNPLDNPLNIVMKVTKCNGYDVAKISDTPGKGMCENDQYVIETQTKIQRRLETAQ